MASQKILVVFGATGNQGGSVIRAILNDPATAAEYHIRAITRDSSKPAAIALAEQGASVLQANLDDKDSLRAALRGAYAVFAVTNALENMNLEQESRQGNNVADVSKELNIQHLIWSSLPYVSKLSAGKYTGAQHFDSKAIVAEYIRSSAIPATTLQLGVFTTFVSMGLIQPRPASVPGRKAYSLVVPLPPTAKLPLLSVTRDAGTYVKAILQNPSVAIGRDFIAAQAWYSIAEIASTLEKEGGIEVEVGRCSYEEYAAGMVAAGVPEYLVTGVCDVFRFGEEFGYFGAGFGLEAGHEFLGDEAEKMETLADWVRGSEFAALR